MTAKYWLRNDDCRKSMLKIKEGVIDTIVTDPPYGLAFMGKKWDKPEKESGRKSLLALQEWYQKWAHIALRTLKPGGYMLCFGGTRTFHRLACGIEDAGFQIKDCLMWIHGQGFPKGKGCLKPAWEPILLCRKPGKGVLPLGINECRIGKENRINLPRSLKDANVALGGGWKIDAVPKLCVGRWPANLILDEEAGRLLDEMSGVSVSRAAARGGTCPGPMGWGQPRADGEIVKGHDDIGGASRFFYCAKASKSERNSGCEKLSKSANRVNAPRSSEEEKHSTKHGNHHPTVKPVSLCKWLVQLVCPRGGKCLDPFMGSGSIGVACLLTGRSYIGIENDTEHGYFEIARKRLERAERKAAMKFDI